MLDTHVFCQESRARLRVEVQQRGRAVDQRRVAHRESVVPSIDFGLYSTVCDVGGGHGHFLSHLLESQPHLDRIVLEIPSVVAETHRHVAARVGVDDCLEYDSGDMFETVPETDVYVLQVILHDWSDEKSEAILSTIRGVVADGGRLFVADPVLPPTGERHPAIPGDINMMVIGGRERAESEFRRLFSHAGWSSSIPGGRLTAAGPSSKRSLARDSLYRKGTTRR